MLAAWLVRDRRTQDSTHIVSCCKWSTQKQETMRDMRFTKMTHSRVTLESFYSSLR
jgi:hypothetical protein